ncbi:class I SAM-dependent methyltransferase [Pseudomonadota bacterium]|nr:class I SAM-dependent methyltransferase [Pseudomonadota bacterium]
MKNYKIVQILKNSNLESSDLWIAEAKFGFPYLKEKIDSMECGAKILEVGCGTGILLSMLAEEFSQHELHGIEPFGDGHALFKDLNSVVRKTGVNIKIQAYEEHNSEKYDLIYCINVFEHVDDWRHFLNWSADNLKEGGVFFVICPNYGFPYEPHFRIPIIFNKNLTFKIFKNYIGRFEQNMDSGTFGLWNSLNFVKKKELRKFFNQAEISQKFVMHDDTSVIDDMVGRISEDVEFKKRQSLMGNIAIFLKKLGIFNLIKLFPNYIPYMKLYFTKREDI